MNFFSKIRISRLPLPTGLDFDGTQKQNVVLSKLALLTIVITSIHIIDETFSPQNTDPNYYYLILIETLLVVFSFITYVLNEYRKHGIAKHIFLLSTNALLFFLNTVVPKESGSFFFFFPLMAGTFIFYGYSESFKRYFYLILTSILFITLTVLDFNIFGLMIDIDTEHDFITNLISSNLLMILTIGFIINLNKKTENNLLNYQHEIKKLLSEVRSKNVNLEKANKELDRFAYSVSHELRAPLVSVLGLINLSKMEKDSLSQEANLDMMTEMIIKLDLFIHDIVNYSRNAKLEVEHEEVDIKSAVDEIIKKYKFTNGTAKIDFQVEVDTNQAFISDKTRVSLILNNLISNSIKYHNYNLPNPFIKIKANLTATQSEIEVSDNGLGIDKEYQSKVFDMFFRASELSKGSGLGLYIVKETVDKLGGDILLESKLGEGSRFVVSLSRSDID